MNRRNLPKEDQEIRLLTRSKPQTDQMLSDAHWQQKSPPLREAQSCEELFYNPAETGSLNQNLKTVCTRPPKMPTDLSLGVSSP